ncbi:MAG: aminotransferase class I/II-fold pyridoxal phosphate-dependent enzyme [Phycisphaeraceae bacterium]|nr:aminotransferase class I/II-fold pyridoxal phosphate-dependent enzyme [Phycisphaeraceae bacterium]
MSRLNVEHASATHLTADGRELLAFAGCNYLGLSQHPAVVQAAQQGLARYGISTTASRETTGNTIEHDLLELELAMLTRREAAILLAEGYTANFAACQALSRTHGVAILDARAHRSLRNAATAAGMQVFEYEHLCPKSARWLVDQHADQGVAILTDGVFAADGAIAPLADLLATLPEQRSTLLVDDCHGLCVLGPRGEGTIAHLALPDDPRLCMTTTLAKGVGCYGGAVLGSTPFIQSVRRVSDVYRRSTPVPTPIAMAARAAISLMRHDTSLLLALRENINAMRQALSAASIPTHADPIPVFTFTLPSQDQMQAVHDFLLRRGIYAPLIEYPGGPGERYFRLTVNAAHTLEHIALLRDSLCQAIEAAGASPAAPPHHT